MTYQQVLEQIESGEIIASALNWYGEEAVRLIKLAVEKQIPKEPYKERLAVGLVYCCKACGKALSETWDYCSKCGQALDWEDWDGS